MLIKHLSNAFRILLFVYTLSVSLGVFSENEVLVGKVIKITDGDTLVILVNRSEVKVRLADIDAPEHNQPYGTRAKQSLAELVFEKTVRVIEEDRDRYGRIVGRIYTDNKDISAEQVKRGYAWVYTQYNRDPFLYLLEWTAKVAKRGLWSEKNPEPPWLFRHPQSTDKPKE